MPGFRNRGFTRTNTGQRHHAPKLPALPGADSRVAGAPVIPRAKSGPGPRDDPYNNPPPSWFGPVTEWAVWYDLTVVRGYKLWTDFTYQQALPAAGANHKGFVRADFTILPGGKGGGGAALAPRGIVINPISALTHPTAALDIIERAILLRNGFLEIFIEEADLQKRAHTVVGLALRGIDVSSRSRGPRFYLG